jgi:hypothetical protein
MEDMSGFLSYFFGMTSAWDSVIATMEFRSSISH